MNDIEFYKSVDDPRGYLDEYPDTHQWRIHLRKKVYFDRKGRSDLSQLPLCYGYDLHESLFSRKYVPKSSWQQLLFAGPNVLILTMDEHRGGHVPDRTVAYWLAVAHYGMEAVNRWILSLPFKILPSMPWKDSNGAEVLARIPDKYKVDKTFDTWYSSVYRKVNIDG